MHMKGTPRTMQDDPVYDDVVAEVRDFLAGRLAVATSAGVEVERVWLDPGIGFGKTVEHNLELIARIDRWPSWPAGRDRSLAEELHRRRHRA